MARPASSIRSIAAKAVQPSTGIRLEIVHDFLGTNLGPPRPRVHGSSAHVPPTVSIRGTKKPPAGPPARLPDSLDIEHRAPASSFEAPLTSAVDRPAIIGFPADCDAGLRNPIHRRAGAHHSRQK